MQVPEHNQMRLDRSTLLRLLGEVDQVLIDRGERVTMYMVGGANLALAIDETRATKDIDSVIKSGHDQLMQAAQTVAENNPGLGIDWINDDFTAGADPTKGLHWQWFDNREEDEPSVLMDGEGLRVELASPEMMLALKTLADRPHDLDDTYKLMRVTNKRTAQDLGRNLGRFTGPRLFRSQSLQGAPVPQVDPTFSRILDMAPADLRPAEPVKVSKPTFTQRVTQFLRRGEQIEASGGDDHEAQL